MASKGRFVLKRPISAVTPPDDPETHGVSPVELKDERNSPDVPQSAEKERSKLVDSLFSSYVAKSIISARKTSVTAERTVTSDDKDKKKKKRKDRSPSRKKSKHSDREQSSSHHRDSDREQSSSHHREVPFDDTPPLKRKRDSTDGFFAKEKFLDVDPDDNSETKDSSNLDGSKKKKKHKHRHKHKESRDKEKDESRSRDVSCLPTEEEDLDVVPGSASPKTRLESVTPEEEKYVKRPVKYKKKSPGSDHHYSDQLEKAYESRLHSLKKNLVKRHQEMKDIAKSYSIPENKIRLYTDMVLIEKRKEEALQEAMAAANATTETENSTKEAAAKKLISNALWQPPTRRIVEEADDTEKTSHGWKTGFLPDPKQATEQATAESEATAGDKTGPDGVQETDEAKKPSLSSQVIIGKKGRTGLRFGLKISELSAQLISSGTKSDGELLQAMLEDGEISDSGKSKASKEASDDEKDVKTKENPFEVEESEKEDLNEISDGALSDTNSEPDDADKKPKKAKKEHKKDKKRRKEKKSSKRSSHDDRPRDRERYDDYNSGRQSRLSNDEYDRGAHHSRHHQSSSAHHERSDRRYNSHSRSGRSKDRNHQDNSRDHSSERWRRSSYRSRSRDRGDYHRRRSRNCSEGSDDLRVKIDKNRLREIAFKNAYRTIQSGAILKPEQVAAIKAGGRSVDELIAHCRHIQERAKNKGSDSSDDDLLGPIDADEDAFIHHPFKLKEVPSMVVNIRNARQIPVASFAERTTQNAELRIQFPVSSGSQHKNKEGEWVPVPPPEKKAAVPKPSTAVSSEDTVIKTEPIPIVAATDIAATPAIALPTVATSTVTLLAPVKPEDRVFPEIPKQNVDVGSIVSERLTALRRLQTNPNDVQAMNQIYKSQTQMNTWVQSKQLPGQFTGHTGLNLLSIKQLSQGGVQPWARKDYLKTANPLTGGIGKALLQRMGWKEGTGLGKDETGKVEPLQLDVKMDRKGLSGEQEVASQPVRGKFAPIRDMSGKHPVSVITELCKRRHWHPPSFEEISESGPPHKKVFVCRVIVNGVGYQPAIGANTKKLSKAQAASACLQELGLIPREQPPQQVQPAPPGTG